jgi:IS4 transposase
MINFPQGSVLLFDRGYVDYGWMNDLDSRKIIFVTRTKDNMAYKTRKVHFKGSRKDGIIKDSTITLTGHYAGKNYPGQLRLVRFWDADQQREIEFMTNNFTWTAQTIADLYKERWNIETFFKNIKQRLRVKTFVGTSPNAVMIQIWTALICYLILSFLKAKAQYGWNLSNLVTFLRMNLFVKIDLWLWLNNPFDEKPPEDDNQWTLFEL